MGHHGGRAFGALLLNPECPHPLHAPPPHTHNTHPFPLDAVPRTAAQVDEFLAQLKPLHEVRWFVNAEVNKSIPEIWHAHVISRLLQGVSEEKHPPQGRSEE